MKSRRQDVSDDHRLVKSRRRYKKEHSESIPVDLVIEILSRLPARSIVRFRCVSKLWASILRRPDFGELFLTRSQARQQLLFICYKGNIGELCFFYSSSQPQYSDDNSTLATASYRMKTPFKSQYDEIGLINGLVFLSDTWVLAGKKRRAMVSRVCNPSTRQSLFLSKLKTTMSNSLHMYLGYDPIEKQFKVLSMTVQVLSEFSQVKVLTLGTKKMSWRKVECCIPHSPYGNVICINGVLYYGAYGPYGPERTTMIVCFDIRSEKFRFMEDINKIIRLEGATLINYNGKLGSVSLDGRRRGRRRRKRRSTSCVLWILEDTEKQEWTKHVHVLPPMLKDVVGRIGVLNVVGTVGGNEIVFSAHIHHSLPFYVFYYNIEQNMVKRVEIQGLEMSMGDKIYTFLNHVEDIKPIHGY